MKVLSLPLFAAPHRVMFLSGILSLLWAFTLWALTLADRVGVGPGVLWHYPPGWMHALLAGGATLPFFIFGFALTAVPRWQGYGDLARPVWLWIWCCLAAGWLLVIAGFWIPGLIVAGMLAVLTGWGGILRVLWRVVNFGDGDHRHARLIWGALAAGWTAMLLWLAFFISGQAIYAQIAIAIGVWWFLLPVYMVVAHRMIPFFSSNVVDGYVMVRPYWALGAIVAASCVHGVLAAVGLPEWFWLADLPAAAVSVLLSRRWWTWQALGNPLLGMLHIGFVWLGVALLLSALQSVAALNGIFILGYAPLHVLTVGFFGSLLLAMVSRVTLGHSGRPLRADRLTWLLFLGLQAVVVLRVCADMAGWPWSGRLMTVAVLGWLGVFGCWSCRYMPIYWRPRADGRAG